MIVPSSESSNKIINQMVTRPVYLVLMSILSSWGLN
jgi:hypothetical protein